MNQSIRNAEIIIGWDVCGKKLALFYGRNVLNQMIRDGGTARHTVAVVQYAENVGHDSPLDLEKHIAAVRVLKGGDDYRTGYEQPSINDAMEAIIHDDHFALEGAFPKVKTVIVSVPPIPEAWKQCVASVVGHGDGIRRVCSVQHQGDLLGYELANGMILPNANETPGDYQQRAIRVIAATGKEMKVMVERS